MRLTLLLISHLFFQFELKTSKCTITILYILIKKYFLLNFPKIDSFIFNYIYNKILIKKKERRNYRTKLPFVAVSRKAATQNNENRIVIILYTLLINNTILLSLF